MSRVNSKDLDIVLGVDFPVLDKGFVRLIDYMGDDSAIVQAARVSYGEGTKTLREDARLIEYLMQHDHMTPFEMCQIKLHVKLPIFIARQWMRHRAFSYNEVSARYSEIANEFYVPNLENIKGQSTKNKQGSGGDLEQNKAVDFQTRLDLSSQERFQEYGYFLKEGVARETAREILPLNTYTEFYVSGDLRSWLHFLKLRMDSHAQFEIREYANAIAEIIKLWVPSTWAAFENNKVGSVTISAEVAAVLRLIVKDAVKGKDCGKHWSDMKKALGME